MLNLLDRICYICPNFDRTLFESFVVNDLVDYSRTKVILVFESPHKDEVETDPRRPLLGQSGKDITRVLDTLVNELHPARKDEPIGKLVNQRNTRFEWLGIMNACQIPMQKSAYKSNPDIRRKYPQFLQNIEDIRNREKDKEIQDILEWLMIDDLKFRVNEVRRRLKNDGTLVPCGKVARRLCRAAGVNTDQLPQVPHPSRGQWLHVLEILNLVQLIKNSR